MNETNQWLSPELIRLIGLALLHFLWQGLALAALASAAMAMLRTASARYLAAVAVLALMVAAPPLTFFALRQGHPMAASSGPTAMFVAESMQSFAPISRAVGQARAAQPASSDSLLWLVEAWVVGVALLSLRPAAGILVIEGLRLKEAVPAAEPLIARCLVLQQRLRLNRVVRYCETLQLTTPAVVGWFRPVVLLPVAALTGLSAQQVEAVIAHELAHVKRLDSFVNLFQIAAETLLFYHPAVWWLSRRIRVERENCCDDIAISVCGDAVEYARALTRMAEWQAAPALAMAANRSPLAARVARLLGLRKFRGGLRSAGLAASMLCLFASLLAGNALFGLARTASAAQSQQSEPTPAAQERGPKKVAPAPAPAAPPIREKAATAQTDQENAQTEPETKGSYIDGLKAEGIENLSVDELISLKVQGVTPEYVRGLHALGIRPDAEGLIGLKVQGVTPDYIRDLRAASGLTLDADEIVGMKVQGVTPEYVRNLRALGFALDAEDIIGMKVQGVTPEYVRALQDLGLKLDANDAIGMKVQGVTPEYVKSLQATEQNLDADEVIAAKVQGITPEFIERARRHGFQNLSLEKLIALKHAGVLD